jgi:hypothetical protein
MATADEVRAELMGTNPPTNHHEVVLFAGGPAPRVAKTLQDKATTAAKEATLYLPRRTPRDPFLRPDEQNKKDTTLGHAIDAASFGRLNFLILKRIADHLDVDISDLV